MLNVTSTVAAVVLLEDDPDDAFFVRRALEKAHFANPILAFAAAEHARDYFERSRLMGPPAVFILDVTLAGGETGIAFLRWLRQQSFPLGATPAMMLTGSDDPDQQDETDMLGSIYFLRKPVTEEALTEAVRSLGLLVTSLSGIATERTIARQR